MEPARRGPRVAGLLALAALVVLGAVGSYLLYRGAVAVGGEGRAFANARTIAEVERRIGLDWEPTAQRSALGRGVLGDILTAFYVLAYWPFLLISLVVTAVRHRSTFRLLRNALLVSGAVGLVTILLVPVAPPRLLDGFEDSVAGSGALRVVAHPSSLFNPHAALPSFHVGWTLLSALALGRMATDGRRWVPLVVPASMSVAVVTTGNHWILDVLAGGAVAALGWRIAPVMQATLDEQRLRRQGPREQSPRGQGARGRGGRRLQRADGRGPG